jgi:uncharacterized protein YjbI with pentapeptide repeats
VLDNGIITDAFVVIEAYRKKMRLVVDSLAALQSEQAQSARCELFAQICSDKSALKRFSVVLDCLLQVATFIGKNNCLSLPDYDKGKQGAMLYQVLYLAFSECSNETAACKQLGRFNFLINQSPFPTAAFAKELSVLAQTLLNNEIFVPRQKLSDCLSAGVSPDTPTIAKQSSLQTAAEALVPFPSTLVPSSARVSLFQGRLSGEEQVIIDRLHDLYMHLHQLLSGVPIDHKPHLMGPEVLQQHTEQYQASLLALYNVLLDLFQQTCQQQSTFLSLLTLIEDENDRHFLANDLDSIIAGLKSILEQCELGIKSIMPAYLFFDLRKINELDYSVELLLNEFHELITNYCPLYYKQLHLFLRFKSKNSCDFNSIITATSFEEKIFPLSDFRGKNLQLADFRGLEIAMDANWDGAVVAGVVTRQDFTSALQSIYLVFFGIKLQDVIAPQLNFAFFKQQVVAHLVKDPFDKKMLKFIWQKATDSSLGVKEMIEQVKILAEHDAKLVAYLSSLNDYTTYPSLDAFINSMRAKLNPQDCDNFHLVLEPYFSSTSYNYQRYEIIKKAAAHKQVLAARLLKEWEDIAIPRCIFGYFLKEIKKIACTADKMRFLAVWNVHCGVLPFTSFEEIVNHLEEQNSELFNCSNYPYYRGTVMPRNLSGMNLRLLKVTNQLDLSHCILDRTVVPEGPGVSFLFPRNLMTSILQYLRPPFGGALRDKVFSKRTVLPEDMSGADLSHSDFTGADFSKVKCDRFTLWYNANLAYITFPEDFHAICFLGAKNLVIPYQLYKRQMTMIFDRDKSVGKNVAGHLMVTFQEQNWIFIDDKGKLDQRELRSLYAFSDLWPVFAEKYCNVVAPKPRRPLHLPFFLHPNGHGQGEVRQVNAVEPPRAINPEVQEEEESCSTVDTIRKKVTK